MQKLPLKVHLVFSSDNCYSYLIKYVLALNFYLVLPLKKYVSRGHVFNSIRDLVRQIQSVWYRLLRGLSNMIKFYKTFKKQLYLTRRFQSVQNAAESGTDLRECCNTHQDIKKTIELNMGEHSKSPILKSRIPHVQIPQHFCDIPHFEFI